MKFSFLQRGLAMVAASVCLASTVSAAPSVDVTGGDVVIQYEPTEDLSNLPLLTGKHASGVKISGLDSAITHRTLRLTVKGGSFDLGNLGPPVYLGGTGQVVLGGGLVYTRKLPDRQIKVTLSDFVVDLTFNQTTSGNPPLTTITYGGTVSAMMTVDGKVVDRVNFWRLDDVAGFYPISLPIAGSYKKANFSIGAMTPLPAAATALSNALGQPAGFNAGLTFGDMLLRIKFKAH